MASMIRPNRLEVSDRFPVLGFTIRVPADRSRFEVAIASEARLFRPEYKHLRSRSNFYASRETGPLQAERGEAVFLVPPGILQRFIGQQRLYYGLTVFSDPSQHKVEVVKIPSESSPWVDIRAFTGRALRRKLAVAAPRGGRGAGDGYEPGAVAEIDWAGDAAIPGMERLPVSPAAPRQNGNAASNGPSNGAAATLPRESGEPTSVEAAFAYDDGFGPMPDPETLEDGGIEGPIPDETAAAAGLAYSRTLEASEYPQSSRFAPAKWFRRTQGRDIRRIVIHITDGGANINGTVSWFRNPVRDGKDVKVSAHYIVGQDGEIVQMVKHKDVAWHARSANSDSIGIEHNANTRGLNPTEAQYCASAALVRWLADQYSIPLDREHILGHSEADPHTSHTGCPNAVWDWDYYMGLVQSASCYPRDGAVTASALGEIPLDPGTGGMSIGPDALVVGDIILSTTDALVSRAIREVTDAPVSHAMLYVGDGMVVEAIGDGVVHRPLSEAIADATVAVTFRHASITPEQTQRAQEFALSKVGQRYDYWGLVEHAAFLVSPRLARYVNLGTDTNDAFFCSELILAAFQRAGAPLADSLPSQASPGDIARLRLSEPDGYPILQYVGHLKAPPLGSSQALGTRRRGHGRSYGADDAVGKATRFGPEVARLVERLKGEGVSEQELNAFLSQMTAGVGSTPAVQAALAAVRTSRAFEREGVEVTLPGGHTLSGWQARLLLSVAGSILSGVGGAVLFNALPEIADRFDVTIGIGPSVSGGLEAGAGLGAGIVFAPGNAVGFYGSLASATGAIESISATLQITIVKGGIENFTGEATAITVAGGEEIVGSGSALFNSAGEFLGISAEIGIGGGVPMEFYRQTLNTYATVQGLALANGNGNGDVVTRARALGPKVAEVIQHLRSEGVNEGELSALVDEIIAGRTAVAAQAFATPPRRARAFDQEGVEVSLPSAVPLDGLRAQAARYLLSKVIGDAILGVIQRTATDSNVTVGLGVVVAGGLGGGGSFGAGIALAPGDVIAVYGSYGAAVGLIGSISAALQVTIVKGGLENFAGTCVAITVSAGEAVDGSGSVLLTPSGDFLGVSLAIGLGVGLPLEFYLQAQRTYTRTLGLSANGTGQAPTAPASGPTIDVHWDDVFLVPDDGSASCWAAAMSTLVGWRDLMSIAPATIEGAPVHPADRASLATAWDLTRPGAGSYGVMDLYHMLVHRGPLWAAVRTPQDPHAFIIYAMCGDSTPDRTWVYIKDPWGQIAGSPRAPRQNPTPGQGGEYRVLFRDLAGQYDPRGIQNAPDANHVDIDVIHVKNLGDRKPGKARCDLLNTHRPTSQAYSSPLALVAMPADGVERMKNEFIGNVRSGSPRSCIVITNAGLRQLYGARLKNPDATEKPLGSTIQDTMAALQGYGLADPETIFEFNDSSGRLTRGVTRPERLQSSVEAWLLSEAEKNSMSGWYVFGLSIMDGYHSVVLALSFGGTANPDTRIYWADQIYSGWDDVTGSLDARITERTQTWWDPLPADRKARTRVTVWPLK